MPEIPPEALERRRPRRYLNVSSTPQQHHRLEHHIDSPHAYGTATGVDDPQWDSPRWDSEPAQDARKWRSPIHQPRSFHEDNINRDRQGKFGAQSQAARWKSSWDSPRWDAEPGHDSLQAAQISAGTALIGDLFRESEHKRGESGQFTSGGEIPGSVPKTVGPHGHFSPDHISAMRQAMSEVKTKDYGRITHLIEGLSQHQLKQISEAAIPHLSMIARNRLIPADQAILAPSSGPPAGLVRLRRRAMDMMRQIVARDAEVTADWSSDWRPPGWDGDAAIAQDRALRQRGRDLARFLVTTANRSRPGMAFDRALVEHPLASQVMRLAMDQTSMRTFSPDGHMHVALSNISRASVNPYWSEEIPNADGLGLKPKTKYMLLRHPDELRKAVQSFNGLPVLIDHKPVSAEEHPQNLVVGSTGTDARWEPPFLVNSLHIWAKPAIDGIQNGERREISCAYHYDPVMTPGVYEGKHFDGVMTNIHGNHVALVESGRVGPAAVVADSMPFDLQIAEFFER